MKLLSENSPQYLERLVRAVNKEYVVYLGGDLECYRVKKVRFSPEKKVLVVTLFNGKRREGIFRFFDGNGKEIVAERVVS